MDKWIKGGYIIAFCSSGPKSYAYIYVTVEGEVKVVCELKGFVLNAENC